MTSHSAKDAYYIGEQANIPIDVDNTDSGADIKSVQGTLVVNLDLNANGY